MQNIFLLLAISHTMVPIERSCGYNNYYCDKKGMLMVNAHVSDCVNYVLRIIANKKYINVLRSHI